MKSSRINSTWGGNLVDMIRSQKYLEIIAEEHLDIRIAPFRLLDCEPLLRIVEGMDGNILRNFLVRRIFDRAKLVRTDRIKKREAEEKHRLAPGRDGLRIQSHREQDAAWWTEAELYRGLIDHSVEGRMLARFPRLLRALHRPPLSLLTGVWAAVLASQGFTGCPDYLDGAHSWGEQFAAGGRGWHPERITAGLGSSAFFAEVKQAAQSAYDCIRKSKDAAGQAAEVQAMAQASLAEARREAEQKGAEIDQEDAGRFWMRDPSGNRIEVVERR